MAFKTYQPTKADQMRAFIAQRKANGQPVRPKDIIEAMEKRGIYVSSGQASVVLQRFSRRRRRRTENTHLVVDGSPVAAPKRQTRHTVKDYASLITAIDFVRNCGGMRKAKKTLDDLTQVFNQVRDE